MANRGLSKDKKPPSNGKEADEKVSKVNGNDPEDDKVPQKTSPGLDKVLKSLII